MKKSSRISGSAFDVLNCPVDSFYDTILPQRNHYVIDAGTDRFPRQGNPERLGNHLQLDILGICKSAQ
jgi:hypothetical protein